MNNFYVIALVSFFISLGLSSLFVPAIAILSEKIGWIDLPGGLKRHKNPIPYGGGIAIILGMLSAFFLSNLSGQNYSEGIAIIIASLLVAVAGGIDDWKPMRILSKFLIQTLAAIILVSMNLHLNIKYLSPSINIALSLLWIVGITNAVNIIDIMDGLCGGICGVASLTLGIIGLMTGDITLAVLCISLAGSITGFLFFNLHPAKIFMGDAGAQFIGFVLAAATIKGAYTTFNNIAIFAPILILGIPIYDTILVSFFRIKKGKSPFHGSPDHIALRMVKLGFSVQNTVRVLVVISFLLSVSAAAATMLEFIPAVILYSIVFFAAVIGAIYIAKVKVE